MDKQKIIFIDRDGTILVEPQDKQIDTLNKWCFMPGIFLALNRLKMAGYRFVLVSNQDGLGSASFPTKDFEGPQQMMVDVLASQGITFDAIRICPHIESDACSCRKPQVGLVMDFLTSQKIDLQNSYVIGDRESDLIFAQRLNIQGIQIGSKATPTWQDVTASILIKPRMATIKRKTQETDIEIEVNLDSRGAKDIDTGIAFFDHMLEQLAAHGGFGLSAKVIGDLVVDDHHTIEDTALALGQAIAQALGDKRGIGRYGFVLPMDEALAQISIDIGGRPYFCFSGDFSRNKIGALSTECIPHFFRSFSQSLGASIHITLTGENTHHKIEAMFKGVGRALRQAFICVDTNIPSTKGVL